MNWPNVENPCDGLEEKVRDGSVPFATNKCWSASGSIDVEDLAKYFGDNRERTNNTVYRTNPNHRVFRNRQLPATSPTVRNLPPISYERRQLDRSTSHRNDNYYGCEYVGKCNQPCQENLRWPEDRVDYAWSYQTGDGKLGAENFRDKSTSERLPIGLPCTEDQWLACPAIDCPIFDNVGNNDAISSTASSFSTNQNDWNLRETVSYFGPVPPACAIYDTPGRDSHRDHAHLPCYPWWEEEQQQFFEDYLSNEKRKEKSRDAARYRRSKETDIFTELASALPLAPEQAAHLDKASVMRLAIAYLKVRSVIDALAEPCVESASLTEMDALFPKALDGFMLILSSNGDMVYLSENVSDYLGVSQMDMMGQSVYEYSHPCDHEELRKCLSMKPSDVKEKHPCNFFLRLKCTLTSKGRKVNLKSASYKVIHCTGRAMGSCEMNTETVDGDSMMISRDEDSCESSSKEESDTEIGSCSKFGYSGASLVVVGCPIPHPSNIEVPLGRQTFLSKHSLNMKFTYADDRLAEYLGWASSELLGKSVFEFHHALDNSALDKSFKSLFSKGQCETMAYRFLGKKGGYAWVVTQATLIHCSKQRKPLSVVCVNHILSGVECEDEVYSERQLEARKAGVTVNTVEDYETAESPNLLSLPSLVLETPSATNTDDSYDGTDELVNENEREEREERDDAKNARVADCKKDTLNLETKIFITERARPLAVTATIFRSQSALASQDSRKELPPSSLSSKVTKTTDNRKERPVWYFQDKPVLEYEPPRNSRPLTVTRNLFVPLGSFQDQELSQQQLEQTANCRPPPQTTTASIFAPRTEDMNKGFLTFSEDQPGLTMLKDEPEDLTHLAPTPGDVCVPLEDTPFLSDMLDEFILGTENYCPLLSPEGLPSELPNSDLTDSVTKENSDIGESLESSLADSDPFIYRDIPSPCSLSPGLLSPATAITAALGKSPDQNSIDSLQSPKHNDMVDGTMSIGSGQTVGNPITEDEMLMLSINDVIGDDELALRAPYIPMSDQDEALQLLISDDTVMWGPTQPPDKKTKWLRESEEKPLSKRYENSSLARLLKNETGLVKYNDHGGGLVDPAQIFGQINAKGNSASRLERPSKRVHASISPSVTTESKRSRFNDSKLPIVQSVTIDVTNVPQIKSSNVSTYDEQSIDLCGILGTDEKIETGTLLGQRGGSRLLLQQLMSRDNAQSTGMGKMRDTTRKDEGILEPIVVANSPSIATSQVVEKEKIGASGDGGGTDGSTENGQRGRRQSNSVLMNLLVSGCDKASGLKTSLQASEKWSPMIVEDSADSQCVSTNNRAGFTFYDEYPDISSNQSSCFGNFFNGDSTDLFSRRNVNSSTTPVSGHRRYVR